MMSREDRLRMQHMRLDMEKKFLAKQSRAGLPKWEEDARTAEEERLKKQHLRLENEKRYNKEHSYLTKDRRLAVQEEKMSKSVHSKPDFDNVKSKLFDFEKSSPRSRRKLMDSEASAPEEPSTTSHVAKTSHAIEATQFNQNIMHNLSVIPTAKGTTRQKSRNEDRSAPCLIQTTVTYEDTPRSPTRLSMYQPDSRTSRRKSDGPLGLSPLRLDRMSENHERRHSETPRITVTEDVDETARLKELYNKAIETVTHCDEVMMASKVTEQPGSLKTRRMSEPRQRSGLDFEALKELESILNDARLYSSRKSSKEDHSRLDLGSNRAQKKRIEHLEQVLKQLDPNYKWTSVELDPRDVLACSYLRLSKSNVEALENLIRKKGQDPGIHIHSDVTNYNIWDGIEKERADRLAAKQCKEPIH